MVHFLLVFGGLGLLMLFLGVVVGFALQIKPGEFRRLAWLFRWYWALVLGGAVLGWYQAQSTGQRASLGLNLLSAAFAIVCFYLGVSWGAKAGFQERRKRK